MATSAGFFILLSVLLAHHHSPYRLLLTGFVGLILLQPAFANWCPMMALLHKLGESQCQPHQLVAEAPK